MKLADVRFEELGDCVVAHISGEIDLSNATALERAIEEAMPNHAMALTFDLTAIDYMDSAGIQLLYQLQENLRVRGQALSLVIPHVSAANDALRLAGVVSRIETFETVEDALCGTPGQATNPGQSDPG